MIIIGVFVVVSLSDIVLDVVSVIFVVWNFVCLCIRVFCEERLEGLMRIGGEVIFLIVLCIRFVIGFVIGNINCSLGCFWLSCFMMLINIGKRCVILDCWLLGKIRMIGFFIVLFRDVWNVFILVVLVKGLFIIGCLIKL